MDFLGKEFIWFTGVVEDVNDPLKMGRCRVRCLGFHTDKKSDLPTKDLPWAVPIQPITSAARSGKGYSPTGLVPGSWIVGFFRDGKNCQEPMIMGSIAGIPQRDTDPGKGFSDPRTNQELKQDPRSGNLAGNGFFLQRYQKDGSGALLLNEPLARRYPHTNYLGEPDTNRLARNENTSESIVELKKQNLDRLVPTADITATSKRAGINNVTTPSTRQVNRGGAWTEPLTPYGAEYPHNHVYESESGHIIEIDDTPQKERLHRYHRSGTFEEIHPNGDRVEKIVRNDYRIVLKNDNLHVDGYKNITVDKACKILVNADASDNDLDIQVERTGNLNIEVTQGNVNLKVGTGDLNLQIENGNVQLHVNGNFDQYVSGNFTQRVDGIYKVQSGGNQYFNAPQVHLNNPRVPFTPTNRQRASIRLPRNSVSADRRFLEQIISRTISFPKAIKTFFAIGFNEIERRFRGLR